MIKEVFIALGQAGNSWGQKIKSNSRNCTNIHYSSCMKVYKSL